MARACPRIARRVEAEGLARPRTRGHDLDAVARSGEAGHQPDLLGRERRTSFKRRLHLDLTDHRAPLTPAPFGGVQQGALDGEQLGRRIAQPAEVERYDAPVASA